MSKSSFKTNGKYIEFIMKKSISYYNSIKMGLFYKSNPNILLLNKQIRFVSKSNSDFFGVFKGKYIEIETKETTKEYFNKKNIKKHQWEQIDLISEQKGLYYFIIYFYFNDTFLMIEGNKLKKIFFKKSKIDFYNLKKNSNKLKLSSPIFLNFLSYIKN